MIVALGFVASWATIVAAVGLALAVGYVVGRAVDALHAWVQPATEEVGKLREERGA